MATRRILVPLDGSTFGEAALPTAIAVAQHLTADIDLLTVTPKAGESGIQAIIEAFSNTEHLEDWTHEYLRALATDLAEVSGREASYQVRSGTPKDAILDYAREQSPSVVVMATHGRGPLTRQWLGSVADAVVREGPVPIVLVRPEDDHPDRRPDLTRQPTFHRIVVPMDGSTYAEESVPWAIQLGDTDASYTLVQAIAWPIAQGMPPILDAPDRFPRLLDAARAEAEAYLTQVADAYRERDHHTMQIEVLADGAPAASILRYVEQHDTDLISIATQGRGRLSRAVLGSVADKIVRAAPCAVLVVPPKSPATDK